MASRHSQGSPNHGVSLAEPNRNRFRLVTTASIALLLAPAALASMNVSLPPQGAGSVEITAPSSGAVLSETVLLRARVLPTLSVTSVQFRLDSTAVGAPDTVAPYSANLATTTFANGTHTLSADVLVAGGTTITAQIPVRIQNGSQPSGGAPQNVKTIVSPLLAYNVTEGEVFGAFFEVDDNANATDTYTVQKVVNGVAGALPTRTWFDPNTRRFHWWTALGDAGTHVFRFRVVDAQGVSAQRDVTITVAARATTAGPIIRVKPSSSAPTSDYIRPGQVVDVSEGSPQVVMKVETTPTTGATGACTLAAASLPAGLTVNPYSTNVFYISGYCSGASAGLYTVVLTSTDSAARQSQFTFQMRVIDQVQSDEYIFIIPKFNGVAQVGTVINHHPIPMRTYAGTMTLNAVLLDKGGAAAHTPPAGVKVAYYVDDTRVAGPAPLGTNVTFNTNTVVDGTHAMSVECVDADSQWHRFQSRIIPFAVENTASPPLINQPQWVPALAPTYRQMFGSQRVDAVYYPGHLQLNQPHAYQWVNSPLPTDSATRLALRSPQHWVYTPLLAACPGLYRPEPRFYRARNTLNASNPLRDKILVHPHYARGASSSEGALPENDRYDWYCGERGNSSVSPYSTFVPHPTERGFIGIDVSGRLFHIYPTGQMRTLAGYVNTRNPGNLDIKPPYLFTDTALPLQTAFAADKELIGNFNGTYFKVSNDLAVDPLDPNIIYVADILNDRIAKVDLRGSAQALVNIGTGVPSITTFAGLPNQTVKYVDGPLSQARFWRPTSLVFDAQGNLIVADRNNCAIRKIFFNGPQAGTVVTVAGGSLNGGTKPVESTVNPSAYPANVPGANPTQTIHDWIRYPQSVRLNSLGHLIVSENLTKTVKDIDLGTGVVRLVKTHILETTNMNDWIWAEVDRNGNIGPVDDIFVPLVGGLGNSSILRISADGTYCQNFIGAQGVFSGGKVDGCVPDLGRHYPWAICIDDNESVALTTGMGSTGPALVRRYIPGVDVVQNDKNAYLNGEAIHWAGTVTKFPYNARPSFIALHGPLGYTRLGTVPTFDDVALNYLYQASTGTVQSAYDTLANSIRAGFGGAIPRPEITGKDMRDYIYFVLRNSIYSQNYTFPLPTIPVDSRMPEIRRLVVRRTPEPNAPGFDQITATFVTDKLAIGAITVSGDGISVAGRLYSIEASNTLGTTHQVTLRNVPAAKDPTFNVLAKDEYGNVTTRSF